MRLVVGLLLPLAGLGVLSLAVAHPVHHPDPQTELAGATGRVKVENRRAGRALLVARRLAPGRSATGSIVLRNNGKRPAALRLTQSVVSSRRGPRGGRLLDVLALTIREAGRRKPVFSGPIRKLRTKKLRRLSGRAKRRYVFTVLMPRSADNRYQAGSLVVRYRWKAYGGSTSTRKKRGR